MRVRKTMKKRRRRIRMKKMKIAEKVLSVAQLICRNPVGFLSSAFVPHPSDEIQKLAPSPPIDLGLKDC